MKTNTVDHIRIALSSLDDLSVIYQTLFNITSELLEAIGNKLTITKFIEKGEQEIYDITFSHPKPSGYTLIELSEKH